MIVVRRLEKGFCETLYPMIYSKFIIFPSHRVILFIVRRRHRGQTFGDHVWISEGEELRRNRSRTHLPGVATGDGRLHEHFLLNHLRGMLSPPPLPLVSSSSTSPYLPLLFILYLVIHLQYMAKLLTASHKTLPKIYILY